MSIMHKSWSNDENQTLSAKDSVRSSHHNQNLRKDRPNSICVECSSLVLLGSPFLVIKCKDGRVTSFIEDKTGRVAVDASSAGLVSAFASASRLASLSRLSLFRVVNGMGGR